MRMGALGFGTGRMTDSEGQADRKAISVMTDAFFRGNMNLIDLKSMNRGLEAVIRECVVRKYERNEYLLSSNMSAFDSTIRYTKEAIINSINNLYSGSYDLLSFGYVNDRNYELYEAADYWNIFRELRRTGQIRKIGFAFDGSPELFRKLIKSANDFDFFRLKLNYLDWFDPGSNCRELYKTAARAKKPIICDSALREGTLTDPPMAVKNELMYNNDSLVKWALRFNISLPGVKSVIVDFSSFDEMEEDISFLSPPKRFDPGEAEAMMKAMSAAVDPRMIKCTACGMCLDECDEHIDIPDIFSYVNTAVGTASGLNDQLSSKYTEQITRCTRCRKCELICPEHIGIVDTLSMCSRTLAKLIGSENNISDDKGE